jgi:hypothetical protein
MTLLWGFDFSLACDERGVEIPIDLDQCAKASLPSPRLQSLHTDHSSSFGVPQGFLSLPLPVKCQIKPRSQQVVDAIESLFLSSTAELERFEYDLDEDDRAYLKALRS